VAQWDLVRAWPSAIKWEALQKTDGTIVEKEDLMLTHEGYTRVATVTSASDNYLPLVTK